MIADASAGSTVGGATSASPPPATPVITARTRVFALLGDPVAHSLSPLFQNAAIRALGRDAIYVALRCDTADVAPLVRALCLAGGGGNVTVPHKAAAAASLDRPSRLVERTGACNTFWAEDGLVCGDNTDVEGFRSTAARLLPRLDGTRVLILGAGGAAAAAACAMLDAGAKRITLLNRSPARAGDLAARLDPDMHTIAVADAPPLVQGEDFDLVVNATSLGMRTDDQLPLELDRLGRAGAAIDIVCRADGETAWVRHARDLGIAAADGTDMLLAQGAAAFRRWFDVEAPVPVMRAALVDRS